MEKKKGFVVYYLLLCEGSAEFNIFAYLTRNKFRWLFDTSSIKFSDKVQVIQAGISQGRLRGIGNVNVFKSKYSLIKKRYPNEKLFFMLDKDLDDSSQIETIIKTGGDIVQFVIYNSEYLLLKLSRKKPKEPSDFTNLKDFRDHCKTDFLKQFGKEAYEFKDRDLDSIFNNLSDEEIKSNFVELFSTLK